MEGLPKDEAIATATSPEPISKPSSDQRRDSYLPVHKLNNPQPLGITIRLKDVALVVATTAISGVIGLNVKNSLQLFLGVVPLQAAMLYHVMILLPLIIITTLITFSYGITRSYFSTRKLAISFTVTATLISSAVTAALAFVITPQTDKHKLLFKPVAWIIEQKAADIVSTVGANVEAITPSVSATEQKVEIYVRGIVAAAITLASGTLSTISASIFLHLLHYKEILIVLIYFPCTHSQAILLNCG